MKPHAQIINLKLKCKPHASDIKLMLKMKLCHYRHTKNLHSLTSVVKWNFGTMKHLVWLTVLVWLRLYRLKKLDKVFGQQNTVEPVTTGYPQDWSVFSETVFNIHRLIYQTVLMMNLIYLQIIIEYMLQMFYMVYITLLHNQYQALLKLIPVICSQETGLLVNLVSI